MTEIRSKKSSRVQDNRVVTAREHQKQQANRAQSAANAQRTRAKSPGLYPKQPSPPRGTVVYEDGSVGRPKTTPGPRKRSTSRGPR